MDEFSEHDFLRWAKERGVVINEQAYAQALRRAGFDLPSAAPDATFKHAPDGRPLEHRR